MTRKPLTLAAAAFALVAAAAAFAADKKPDGTVSISEKQIALVVGGSIGGGTLSFQGKTYDFKISGLSTGANVGVSRMSAAGEVWDLADVAKFPGTYTKLEVGATAGGGVGALTLKNEHGVRMTLRSRSQGVQLNAGSATGVKVTMK